MVIDGEMASAVLKSPGKNGGKWNWAPVLRDVEMGMSLRDAEAKYSIPRGSIRKKVALHRKVAFEVAREVENIGLGETRLPAPFTKPPQMVQKVTEITENPASPAELTQDQLVTLFSDVDASLLLDPAAFEKLVGKRIQGALASSLVDLPEVRTLKDVATLHKIFRDASGLTDKAGAGANGLLSPPRSFGRRSLTLEASIIPSPVVIEEPEGGWPEGM